MGWGSPDPHKKVDMNLILAYSDAMYGNKWILYISNLEYFPP